MSSERRSLQDRIRARQQNGFVGRQWQLTQYRENFGYAVDDERRLFLFNIHGDAGAGKTFLTRQFRQIANSAGALTAYIDETVEDVTSAMTAIADEFSRAGSKLTDFEKRAVEYQQRRHELESDPEAPAGFASFLTKTAVTISLAAARDIPIAGGLLAPIDPAAAADQANRVREYLARKISDHRDVRLLLSPADELTPIFVAGVNRAAMGRTTALFFDTYERTAPLLDKWLRNLYAGRYGNLPETLITTISGQKPLDPNLWGEYISVVADIPLEPFSEFEARQFLASKGIKEESAIQVILTLSGRLPLWLATLADARLQGSADIGDPSGSAVERFLKWEEDPARRRIAITAALPRLINHDVLKIITSADKAHEQFDWLCGLPFVSLRGEAWVYHDVVRAAMLRLRRAEAPAEWRSQHNLLAQANSEWANEAAFDTDSGTWGNSNWIDYTCEEMYHLLCADPLRNLPKALSLAVKAAGISSTRARQWAELISDAGRDTNNIQLIEWGMCLRDGIHENGLEQYLTQLINKARLDESMTILSLLERGRSYRSTGHYDEAITDLTRAIELDPSGYRAIVLRGLTYFQLQRYDEAIADLTRVIELDPDHPVFPRLILVLRGMTHSQLKRYDEALRDLARAIELDPDWTGLSTRGETYRLMGRYEDALIDFNRAIKLAPEEAWTIGSRGQGYFAMDRYEEALADFNRAIELDPEQAWIIGARGEVYKVMGRYDEAIADLTRVIELASSDVTTIVKRGLLYNKIEFFDKTIADLTRAIELAPDQSTLLANIIFFRGMTYWRAQRYDEALPDLTRAIELNPGRDDLPLFLALRGVTYQQTQRYNGALADLTRAIELAPDRAWIIGARGEVYKAMDRHDEAITDLTRAIELDPADQAAIAARGETYRLMGHYERACTDYSRLIELNPSNGKFSAEYAELLRLVGKEGRASSTQED